MRVHVFIATALAANASCFEENLGNTVDAAPDVELGAGQCAPAPDAGLPPGADASISGGYSNGVAPHGDLDPDGVTTIDSHCDVDVNVGSIECDGLALRPNVAGVYNNIGYERVAPTESDCAGGAGAPAPGIGVFSFGSLVMAPGARFSFRGERAVALVAVRSIQLSGEVEVWGEIGGFVNDSNTADALLTYGPAPGVSVRNVDEGRMGAPGAGGAGVGGAGGNCGTGISATVPQFEPLCGGSSGGSVGHDFPNGGGAMYAEGGHGGGALLVAAGESIAFSGEAPCGLHANAGGGEASEMGGAGGGSGGTILLEAPAITPGDCWITANGAGGGAGGAIGNGHQGKSSNDESPGPGGAGPDYGGAGGALAAQAQSGIQGDFGGGGGGAAGFIRVRTDQCSSLPAQFSPAPTCEQLAP